MRQNKDDSKQLKTTTIQYNHTKRVMANKEMGNGDGVTLEGRKKTRMWRGVRSGRMSWRVREWMDRDKR